MAQIRSQPVYSLNRLDRVTGSDFFVRRPDSGHASELIELFARQILSSIVGATSIYSGLSQWLLHKMGEHAEAGRRLRR